MVRKLACNVTKEDVELVVEVTGIPKFHWHDSLKHLMQPRESGAVVAASGATATGASHGDTEEDHDEHVEQDREHHHRRHQR